MRWPWLITHLSRLGMQIRVEIRPAKGLKGGHYGGIQQVLIPNAIRPAGLSDEPAMDGTDLARCDTFHLASSS
jgi:hypothetical protein